MFKLLSLIAVPIRLMNYFAGIVGGIWLLIIGEWRLVVLGLVALLIMHWVVSILLMVNLPFLALALNWEKKRNPLWYLVSFFTIAYTYALMLATCYGAWAVGLGSHHYRVDFGAVPFLLWAWSVGLGYWQYSASDEANLGEVIALFSVSFFYLALLAAWFLPVPVQIAIILVWVPVQLLVIPIFQLFLAKKLSKA